MRAYQADNAREWKHRYCEESQITDRELDVLSAFVHANHPINGRFATTVELAAAYNELQLKETHPSTWGDLMITPLRLEALLEQLYRRQGSERFAGAGSVGIERKVMPVIDDNGNYVLIPHYRFESNDMIDRSDMYAEAYDAEQEMKHRLVRMGVLVRSARGEWINKYEERILFTVPPPVRTERTV